MDVDEFNNKFNQKQQDEQAKAEPNAQKQDEKEEAKPEAMEASNQDLTRKEEISNDVYDAFNDGTMFGQIMAGSVGELAARAAHKVEQGFNSGVDAFKERLGSSPTEESEFKQEQNKTTERPPVNIPEPKEQAEPSQQAKPDKDKGMDM